MQKVFRGIEMPRLAQVLCALLSVIWSSVLCDNTEPPNEIPVTTSSLDNVRFENHKLYSVSLSGTKDHAEKLIKLRERVDIDFWNEPETNAKVNFRVPPVYQHDVESYLNKSSLTYSVITADLQKWIDRERAENMEESDYLSGRQDAASIAFDHYHTYQEIYSFLEALQAKYPTVLQLVTIGKTYESHDIRLAKISLPQEANSTNSSLARKPAFWLDAGIHAREWVAPATAVWIINELVTKQETDDEIRELVKKFDWYILPVANPDGYMYTWWTNRLWRKNRALPKALPIRYPWALFDECLGTDPNRNFDIDFGGASTSSNPCSDIFRGDQPFSEMETRAIRDAVLDLGKDLRVFVSLHSYSQMWMFPWGLQFQTLAAS